jgi:hypothetical protein
MDTFFTANIEIAGGANYRNIVEDINNCGYNVLRWGVVDRSEERILAMLVSTKYALDSKIIRDMEGKCLAYGVDFIAIKGVNFSMLVYRIDFDWFKQEFDEGSFVEAPKLGDKLTFYLLINPFLQSMVITLYEESVEWHYSGEESWEEFILCGREFKISLAYYDKLELAIYDASGGVVVEGSEHDIIFKITH